MNRNTTRRVGVAVLILLIGLLAFFSSSPRPASEPVVRLDGRATPASNLNPSTTYARLPAADPNDYNPTLPQWKEWRQRNAADPKWEWKVPIAFFGQVLDQNDVPVTQAKITLSITDLSARGASVRELTTDAQGKFSLDDAKGKHLLVRSIEKEGFKYGTQKQDGFEYAAFFDADYYTPDSKPPTIFRLYKEAVAEPLIVVSDKYRIPADGTFAIDLKTGREGGNDLSIEIVDNSDPTGKKWAVKVKAPSGLQVAEDQFASVAPESGYESEIAIDQDTKQPSGFQSGSLYKGGRFYVKTTSGYALVDFRMVAGKKSLRLTSYLNPKPGSRNLEFDPAKVVKSP